MKEGRIFEYTIEHISIFKHLFEILSNVLHELEIIHIQPDKPIDNENQDSESGSESESKSESGSEAESGSESESEDEKPKKKNNTKVLMKKKTKAKSESDTSSDESDSDEDSNKKSNKKIDKKTEKKGGIKIIEINDYESIIIIIKLDADSFYKFDCKKPTFSIGMDPTNMFNILKNIDKEGHVTFYVNEQNKQTLNIELQNNEKKSRSIYDFKLMELDERKISPLPPEFDINVQMKTKDFHDICKELSTYSQFMIIECTDKKIQFKCKGAVREFEHDEDGKDSCVFIRLNPKRDKSKPVIVREIYDLNDICMFNKCKNISTNVNILLRNEYIMFVRYKVASYGTMTVGFNPANEKLVNKHANYDGEKFDAFYKPADVKYKQ
jgi:proliferating cell nuclear antigen PCNA